MMKMPMFPHRPPYTGMGMGMGMPGGMMGMPKMMGWEIRRGFMTGESRRSEKKLSPEMKEIGPNSDHDYDEMRNCEKRKRKQKWAQIAQLSFLRRKSWTTRDCAYFPSKLRGLKKSCIHILACKKVERGLVLYGCGDILKRRRVWPKLVGRHSNEITIFFAFNFFFFYKRKLR